jgi:hypothetical protein
VFVGDEQHVDRPWRPTTFHEGGFVLPRLVTAPSQPWVCFPDGVVRPLYPTQLQLPSAITQIVVDRGYARLVSEVCLAVEVRAGELVPVSVLTSTDTPMSGLASEAAPAVSLGSSGGPVPTLTSKEEPKG